MESRKIKKVYIAEYNGNFKIGVSNNVHARINQLSCGCPTIRIVYQSGYLSNAFDVESLLHEIYKEKNIGGEWFYDVDIEEISKIIEKHGDFTDYEKCKSEEIKKMKEEIKKFSLKTNKHFDNIISNKNYYFEKVDDRNMTIEELKYENDQISKFVISVSGTDVPNIYSDLIYNILFGKSTEKLIEEYKINEFESFRKYLSDEQNDVIKIYSYIIVDMINSYWNFDKIKKYIEMIQL